MHELEKSKKKMEQEIVELTQSLEVCSPRHSAGNELCVITASYSRLIPCNECVTRSIQSTNTSSLLSSFVFHLKLVDFV